MRAAYLRLRLNSSTPSLLSHRGTQMRYAPDPPSRHAALHSHDRNPCLHTERAWELDGETVFVLAGPRFVGMCPHPGLRLCLPSLLFLGAAELATHRHAGIRR